MRKIIVGTFVIGISAIATAGPALAQPTEDRNRSTVGYCVSDVVYGNEPNLDDPDNPFRGRSVGQFNQDGINITQLCRTAFGSGSD